MYDRFESILLVQCNVAESWDDSSSHGMTVRVIP